MHDIHHQNGQVTQRGPPRSQITVNITRKVQFNKVFHSWQIKVQLMLIEKCSTSTLIYGIIHINQIHGVKGYDKYNIYNVCNNQIIKSCKHCEFSGFCPLASFLHVHLFIILGWKTNMLQFSTSKNLAIYCAIKCNPFFKDFRFISLIFMFIQILNIQCPQNFTELAKEIHLNAPNFIRKW